MVTRVIDEGLDELDVTNSDTLKSSEELDDLEDIEIRCFAMASGILEELNDKADFVLGKGLDGRARDQKHVRGIRLRLLFGLALDSFMLALPRPIPSIPIFAAVLLMLARNAGLPWQRLGFGQEVTFIVLKCFPSSSSSTRTRGISFSGSLRRRRLVSSRRIGREIPLRRSESGPCLNIAYLTSGPRPSFRAPEALCNQRRFLNYSEKRGS